jgi:hypothetical protein
MAVCRMLVKMGLEVVAADSYEDARDKRFDSTRSFARFPARGMEWWWFMSTDHTPAFRIAVLRPMLWRLF